jgi:hypothetical protein
MDTAILHAIWFDCQDLSDSERTLLQALAYHCHNTYTCWPSVPRLARMIRRTERHTRRLLQSLEKAGYITIQERRGRGHSNLYILNRTQICQVLEKTGHPDVRSKPDTQMSPELLKEEERKKEETPEELLLRLGLTPGSGVWIASLNGHQK